MKKLINLKAIATMVTLLFSMTVIFTACGSSNESNSGKLQGKISVVGSTSVQPLAQELADDFNITETELLIDIQGVGSSAGIKAITDGTCDIGASSRELTKEEQAAGLTEKVIAIDGIAAIVNSSNSASDLTKEQLAKIFKGEIKNWKEVGGVDKEILVVSREAGSGTRGAFEELLKLQKKEGDKTISLVKSDALIAEGNGAVKANIASKDNAIGYISIGFVDKTVKALKIGGIEATEANVKAKTYSISRPFLMLTKGEMKPEVKAFMDYILGDKGQAVVAKKYISVK